ncbi:hypothetical protein PC122_g13590 [Phytophthora cactorum]|nr:hypothetical protein PC122_g13590 [Phytophthora cactorum]
MGLGAPSTLRYDIVRLVLKTFDFWFFSCTTTLTASMISIYFWDLRVCRMMIDWIGFHNIVFIDAQVRGIRSFVIVTILGIPPLLFMLLWIMLGRLDGCTSFSVLSHSNKHVHFSLSIVDIIGNGMITLSLLITKIVVRKRQTLQLRQKSSIIECVIYRCGLKLEKIQGATIVHAKKARSELSGRKHAVAASTSSQIVCEQTMIQQMMFIKFPDTFDSKHVILRLRVAGTSLVLLYAVGILGIVTSFSTLAYDFNSTQSSALFIQAWGALFCTLVFVTPFTALYQRELLKLLVTSFDFFFYAFQVTTATLSVCIFFVAVVNAQTGQILSLISIFLWIPLGFGAFSTLRYDVVRLLMGTFDFWFFSFVTTITAVLVSAYFRDLRFLRMIIDWVGFHHIVCIDAHVRGVRQFALMTIVGIPPVLFMLVWIMLGHVDGCTSFSILEYENEHHSFHLSGVDIIGNGLLTLALFITKIAVRKRRALRISQRSSLIQCVIYRCALQLVQVQRTPLAASTKTQLARIVRRRAVGTNTARKVMLRETNVIQKMKFVKPSQIFDASHTVFPLRQSENPVSAWYLLPLYVLGASGFLLSYSVFLGRVNGTASLVEAWCALLWTLAFVALFTALYHRQLLKLLVTSFDFIFYAFQVTAANLCVCILSRWELSRCITVLTWEIWFLWSLTLDALTPVIRDKLRFRVRFAALVVALLLLAHLVIMNRIFFVGDETLQDAVIFERVVWGHTVVVRVVPFYFSRVATLSLWCPRLIWRLTVASNTELTIIRGAVCYNNYIPKEKRQHSRADRIEPVPLTDTHGPAFSALSPMH